MLTSSSVSLTHLLLFLCRPILYVQDTVVGTERYLLVPWCGGGKLPMATAVSPGEQCPECGGQLQQTGQLVCTECHIVVDDAVIDPGPEWRRFTDDDVDRRRTGPPNTKKLHDGGLSTIIGTVNDRAQLSGQKRRRMERQRTHHTRAQTRSKAERNQRYALSQVQRIASALDCSDEVTEDSRRKPCPSGRE